MLLQAKIKEDDHIIYDYFKEFPKGDITSEVRRLLRIAVAYEKSKETSSFMTNK